MTDYEVKLELGTHTWNVIVEAEDEVTAEDAAFESVHDELPDIYEGLVVTVEEVHYPDVFKLFGGEEASKARQATLANLDRTMRNLTEMRVPLEGYDRMYTRFIKIVSKQDSFGAYVPSYLDQIRKGAEEAVRNGGHIQAIILSYDKMKQVVDSFYNGGSNE